MKKSNNSPKQRPKNVLSATHDPRTDELHVTFGNGKIYTYSGVSADKHKEMMQSPSLGSYLHANIAGKHAFTKKQLK